jgi:hypothetical protein
MTLIVSGFSFAMFSSPNTRAIMGSVDKQYYGVASGILATMRMTGQTLSMVIAMLFFALFHRQSSALPALLSRLLQDFPHGIRLLHFPLYPGRLCLSRPRGKILPLPLTSSRKTLNEVSPGNQPLSMSLMSEVKVGKANMKSLRSLDVMLNCLARAKILMSSCPL